MNGLKGCFQVLLISLILSSCGSSRIKRELTKSLEQTSRQHFVGLMVYDPLSQDTLYNYNADRYFTPASNTKIYTLFAGLKMLGDSLPLFKYEESVDTLKLMGTGSPVLLHPYFKDSTAIKLAAQFNNILLILDNFEDDKYAPGWAWEDYPYYYSPERSGFPIYGNVVTINNENGLEVRPEFFKKSTFYSSITNRDYSTNIFSYDRDRKRETSIPFTTDSLTIKSIWENELGKAVSLISNDKPFLMQTVYSAMPADSLYQRMMYESDNFLAEQILVMASSVLSDTLNTQKIRNELINKYLPNVKLKPRWVDGSGLSRYNLFTPSSFVHVLDILYKAYPESKLFNLFPAGGKNGTLENWYKGNPQPYVYAKSGTLGNNYNLSGYLKTNSGKVLIFSFMNNHFLKSTDSVKKEIERVLELLRDNH